MGKPVNNSSNKEPKFYVGEVIEVCDSEHAKEYHLIKAKIPGIVDSVRAYPKAGELDEPRVGDQVLLLCLDPVWFSYFIYSKLKEDDFIGFRSSGKLLDITPEAMKLVCYDCDNPHEQERPETDIKAKISLQSDGDIDIYSTGKVSVNHGTHGGAVNINSLKAFIMAVASDLKLAKSGVNVDAWLAEPGLGLSSLEDEDFKH